MKNTKKRALLSILSLALSFIMLVGTTYAWFTDSVTSTGNKIESGSLKLDLELLDKNDNTWSSIKESKIPLFTHENWEPGYVDVTVLKIENEGSLALKWQARFISANGVSELAKAIDVYVKPSAIEISYPASRSEISAENGWQNVGALDRFIDTIADTTYGDLLPEQCAYLGIALKMREDAGNEYQDLTLGAFDIRIVATQMANESDDIGTDYDNNAEWPEFEMSFEAKTSLGGVAMLHGELAEDVIIRHEATGAYAVVPAGVKLKNGVTELTFTGKSLANDGNVSDSARNYDIHIEGIADDNTTCITVYIGEILPAGIADTALKLYHEENLMTRVDSVADFSINNQFTYDPATGAVVLYVDNFSVFSAVETEADIWDGASDTIWYNDNDTEFTLATAEQFAGFRDLVDGGYTFEGKTVKLGVDIDLADKNFDPIGYGYVDKGGFAFMGTFDGGNHAIYNLYQDGWDLGYSYCTAGGGLFASIKDATIKNLAISGANIVMECVDMGTVVGYAQGNCTFENIIVTNSKLANYQRYTGGVVGEVCKGEDSNQDYTHIFKNIVVDSSVKISSLWGDFDNACGGVIGGKWGTARVLMQNVTVAAEIDAFSDVTAAYQWYAYRRCGMLIGHTEQNSPKKALNAAADFLTCQDVNVFYGDWANYTYYQFTNQTDGEDNDLWYGDYPWVRAEKGEHNGAFSNVRYGNPIVGGVAINTPELAEANKTGYTTITFNQLYGGGQGVYGCATHSGVTVTNKLTKTIYIEGITWAQAQLDYWFVCGDDEWTTIVDPETVTPVGENVYKIVVPAYAAECKLVDTTNESNKIEIDLSGRLDGEHVSIDENGDVNHKHNYIHRLCICGNVLALDDNRYDAIDLAGDANDVPIYFYVNHTVANDGSVGGDYARLTSTVDGGISTAQIILSRYPDAKRPANIGEAKYIVLRLRTSNDAQECSIFFESRDVSGALNSVGLDLSSEWTTYVIDIAAAFGDAYTTTDGNAILRTFYFHLPNMEKGRTLDIQYVAFCDTWENVAETSNDATVQYVTSTHSVTTVNNDGTCTGAHYIVESLEEDNTIVWKCGAVNCGVEIGSKQKPQNATVYKSALDITKVSSVKNETTFNWEDGEYFARIVGHSGSMAFNLYTNANGDVETGSFLVLKYRVVSDESNQQRQIVMYTSTQKNAAVGETEGLKLMPGKVNDGEWHIAVIDLSVAVGDKSNAQIPAGGTYTADNGAYYARFLEMRPFLTSQENTVDENDTMDIAYVAFFTSLEDAVGMVDTETYDYYTTSATPTIVTASNSDTSVTE